MIWKMGRLKSTLFPICIFLLCLNLSKSAQYARNDVNELRRKFININEEIWSIISSETNAGAPHTQSQKIALEKHREFIEELEKIMPDREKELSYGLESLNQNRLWMSLYSEMRPIFTLFENFKKIILTENSVPSPEEQYLEFSTTSLDDFTKYKYLRSTVPRSMKKISEYVKGRNLFLNVYLDVAFRPCELRESSNQILYNLYEALALIQLKGYVMTQFAHTILTINDKGKGINNVQKNTEEFNKSSKEAIEYVKSAMQKSNNEIWKCDPAQYVAEETYTELTQLLQGYLENEVDMNPRSNCLQNCAYYDYTNHMNCYRGICKQQRICKGKIVECKYVASDMTVCEADKRSGKRYDYIEYDNDRVFGRNTGCKRGTTRVESWWRWLFWHCSYCICLCDDAHPQSDRYFNLRPVVSDISNNMVVTGVRFRKVDQVIHLQIQEAKLLPHGNVNSTLSRWKPIESFKVTDKYVRVGDDYHTMSYENRDIDLDDLTLDTGYLVTGVKFRVVGTHLNFEIRATPFNFTTGYLIQPNIKSYWHSSDETLNRNKLDLISPDLPTRTIQPSKLDSKTNMYLEFRNSDLERDVGQATIPFIDIQDVTSDVQVPLSGAGIYHKGQVNFGGFIGPKIMTYDYGHHIVL